MCDIKYNIIVFSFLKDNDLSIEFEEDRISGKQWAELNSIGLLKHNDQTFMRKVIEMLYDGTEAKLQTKSVSGRKHSNQLSTITPEKKKLLQSIFQKRITKIEEMDPSEKYARLRAAYINQLISNSIQSIKKKKQDEFHLIF